MTSHVRMGIDVSRLILLIQKRPHIWDTADLAYGDRSKRLEAWSDIVTSLYPDWDDATAKEQKVIMTDVKNRWRSVRDQFRKCSQEEERNGSSPTRKKCAYYEELQFLRTRELKKTQGKRTASPIDPKLVEDSKETQRSTESVDIVSPELSQISKETASGSSQEPPIASRRAAAHNAKERPARQGKERQRASGEHVMEEALSIMRQLNTTDQWASIGNSLAARLRELPRDRQWPCVTMLFTLMDLFATAPTIPDTVSLLVGMQNIMSGQGHSSLPNPHPQQTFPKPPHSGLSSPPAPPDSSSFVQASLFPGSTSPIPFPEATQDPSPH